ncbi:putative uncharacterized protein [Rhodococcus sp. AW25M09]|nr:putative uncharacterized protein [Rhodococcus sp. AW25M09]
MGEEAALQQRGDCDVAHVRQKGQIDRIDCVDEFVHIASMSESSVGHGIRPVLGTQRSEFPQDVEGCGIELVVSIVVVHRDQHKRDGQEGGTSTNPRVFPKMCV